MGTLAKFRDDEEGPLSSINIVPFVDIVLVQVAVPDFVGVHDHHRAFRAPVQTTGGVDTDFAGPGNPQFLGALLGIVAHRLRIETLAARRSVLAQIGTEEHVVAVIGHAGKIPDRGKT